MTPKMRSTPRHPTPAIPIANTHRSTFAEGAPSEEYMVGFLPFNGWIGREFLNAEVNFDKVAGSTGMGFAATNHSTPGEQGGVVVDPS